MKAGLVGGRPGEKTSRRLFTHALWYLPVMLGFMMVYKNGVEWRKVFGFNEAEASIHERRETEGSRIVKTGSDAKHTLS